MHPNFEKLFTFIEQGDVRFNEKELAFLEEHFTYKAYKKNEIITAEGKVEQYGYFILEGIVRIYFLKEANDYSLDFWFPGYFATSLTSYLTQKPSQVYLQAIKPVKVLRIHRKHIYEMYEWSKNAERFGRLMMETLYIRKNIRDMAFIHLNAQQRYQKLFEENPLFVQEIPVKYLATFLGVSKEGLSRIRSKFRG